MGGNRAPRVPQNAPELTGSFSLAVVTKLLGAGPRAGVEMRDTALPSGGGLLPSGETSHN